MISINAFQRRFSTRDGMLVLALFVAFAFQSCVRHKFVSEDACVQMCGTSTCAQVQASLGQLSCTAFMGIGCDCTGCCGSPMDCTFFQHDANIVGLSMYVLPAFLLVGIMLTVAIVPSLLTRFCKMSFHIARPSKSLSIGSKTITLNVHADMSVAQLKHHFLATVGNQNSVMRSARHYSQLMKIVVMILVCSSSIVHADTSVDDRMSLEAMMAKMGKMQEQMDKQMKQKDEAIAALTDALKAKSEHKQVQLTAGGEVMQLVSAADFQELVARVDKCEKSNANQDTKLGMTMETLAKMRKESKDGRVGAPPALPPSPPPPLPPPRPVATTGRRLSSSSNWNFVNELSITGSNAVVSWNSHTPGMTSFNCTGVGDGKLTCSGEIRATDFSTTEGESFAAMAAEMVRLKRFGTSVADMMTLILSMNATIASQQEIILSQQDSYEAMQRQQSSFEADLNMVKEHVGLLPPPPPSSPSPHLPPRPPGSNSFAIYTGAMFDSGHGNRYSFQGLQNCIDECVSDSLCTAFYTYPTSSGIGCQHKYYTERPVMCSTGSYTVYLKLGVASGGVCQPPSPPASPPNPPVSPHPPMSPPLTPASPSPPLPPASPSCLPSSCLYNGRNWTSYTYTGGSCAGGPGVPYGPCSGDYCCLNYCSYGSSTSAPFVYGTGSAWCCFPKC